MRTSKRFKWEEVTMKRQAKEEAYILEICRMAVWMRDQRVNQAWRGQVRQ